MVRSFSFRKESEGSLSPAVQGMNTPIYYQNESTDRGVFYEWLWTMMLGSDCGAIDHYVSFAGYCLLASGSITDTKMLISEIFELKPRTELDGKIPHCSVTSPSEQIKFSVQKWWASCGRFVFPHRFSCRLLVSSFCLVGCKLLRRRLFWMNSMEHLLKSMKGNIWRRVFSFYQHYDGLRPFSHLIPVNEACLGMKYIPHGWKQIFHVLPQ